ncbi:MAG TPA: HIT domain-containing protein [Thermomicrobiales bacterium]|nr:HIT domain-containing protein [Thermomicrobiales bacterium]
MERLWTPWRMTYVGGTHQEGCVFCNALAAGDDVGRLVLYRGQHAFVILNLYPYNSGHAMVVPNQHVAELDALDSATRSELFELATLLTEAAKTVLHCEGFNLGLNIGSIAGAGVAEHLHMHVVPRWSGDANFMPILANTMVMPELLPVTYARLRAELEGLLAHRERQAVLQAGAVVVIPELGQVALRRGTTGDIALPKGHLESRESLAETAIREVLEETGIAATIAGWAGCTEFDYPPGGRSSQLHYAAYFVATGTPTPELDQHLKTDTILVPVASAAERITVPAVRAIVERVTPLLHGLCESLA